MGNARSSVVPSQEVRELELSGGVRSLPQVPWWNAGRRARPKRKGGASRLLRGAPCTPFACGPWNTASAGVPLPFICWKRAVKSFVARMTKRNPGAAVKPDDRTRISLRSSGLRIRAVRHRCLTSLAGDCARETGIVLHPPPR